MRPALFGRLRDGIAVAGIVIMMGIVLRTAVLAAGDRNRGCVDNVFKISTALQMYVQDYDEILPPMDDFTQFAQAVTPYLKYPNVYNILRCPATKNTPYVPNPALSHKAIASFENEGATEVLRDGKAHPDGKFTVLYLDGSIFRGDQEQQPTDGKNLCIRNVQLLTLAIRMYAQDYDETLPIYNSNADVKPLLFPYLKSDRFFQCPETNVPYNFNLGISGVNLFQFPDYSAVEVVRDAVANPDNAFTVGYLDGYVERGGVAYPNNEEECLRRARRLAFLMLSYAQNNDEALPPMTGIAALKKVLMPDYTKEGRLFYCPETKQNFVLNSALNGLKLGQITSPATTVLFKEPKAHKKDGKITVAYCDGHANRVLP